MNYPKPDLSRFASRQMLISMNRQTLEMDLMKWATEICHRTRQPPERGVHPATILMGTAQDSIDVLMHAPPSMSLSSKRTVYAHWLWGRFADGHWYVSSLWFGLSLSAAQEYHARQRALKARLLARAEIWNAEHTNLRRVVFPAEDHVDTWHHDIALGDEIIKKAVERAHEHAKKDAAMLENPVTPVDMALDLVGMGAGHLAGSEVRGAKKVAKGLDKAVEDLSPGERWAYEANNMHQILDDERMAGARNLNEARERLVHAKELGGAARSAREGEYIDTGLDLAGFIPVAGPFIKTLAGMFFEIAIASDAARVTRLRSRCYIFFVAGYIQGLALLSTGKPPRKLDKRYFDLGKAAAPGLNSPGNFRAQVSLMHFASDHYTDGGWQGLSFRPQNWHFPDQYIVKWSPDLLGRALATQLHTPKNLME